MFKRVDISVISNAIDMFIIYIYIYILHNICYIICIVGQECHVTSFSLPHARFIIINSIVHKLFNTYFV